MKIIQNQKGSAVLLIFCIIVLLAVGGGAVAYLKIGRTAKPSLVSEEKQSVSTTEEKNNNEIIIVDSDKQSEQEANDKESVENISDYSAGDVIDPDFNGAPIDEENKRDESFDSLLRQSEDLKRAAEFSETPKLTVGLRDFQRVRQLTQLQTILTNYYYANSNKYPETLFELTPNYTAEIPRDPNGKLYSYYVSYERDASILQTALEDKNNTNLDFDIDGVIGIKGGGGFLIKIDCNDPIYCLEPKIFN